METKSSHITKSALACIATVALSVSPVFAATHQSNQTTTTSPSVSKTTDMMALIQEVNPYITTAQNGTESISNANLKKLKLNSDEISFVKRGIEKYNKYVLAGAVNSASHLNASFSSPDLQSMPLAINSASSLSIPSSTGGLPYYWFTAGTPEYASFYYWWGKLTVLNELATQHLEGALNAVAGGAGAAAAATVWIPFMGQADAAFLGAFSGLTWASAGFLQARDNGYGDSIKYLGGSVPYWAYPNTP